MNSQTDAQPRCVAQSAAIVFSPPEGDFINLHGLAGTADFFGGTGDGIHHRLSAEHRPAGGGVLSNVQFETDGVCG